MNLFDRKRKSLTRPVDEEIEIPYVERKKAQVLALYADKVQLMDLQDYSIFELQVPAELKGKLERGQEIFYFEIIGKKTLERIK